MSSIDKYGCTTNCLGNAPARVPPAQRHAGVHQRGVALAISLILIAVIGLGSVTAMKSGIFGTMIAGNLRASEQAVQAAETALRFCERMAMTLPPGVPVQPLPLQDTDRPQAWNVVANWSPGSPMVATIPANIIESPANNVTYSQRPQCLVERMELRAVRGAIDEEAYQITARGFSPNYRTDGQGVVNGAQVWLQTTIRFTP